MKKKYERMCLYFGYVWKQDHEQAYCEECGDEDTVEVADWWEEE